MAIAKELGYTAEIVTIGIEVGEIQAFSREIDPAVRVGIRVAEEKILAILEDWIDCSGNYKAVVIPSDEAQGSCQPLF